MEALAMYEKSSVDRSLKKLGDDHPDVATTYNNMAVYMNQGKYEEALAMYEKALSIRKLSSETVPTTTTRADDGCLVASFVAVLCCTLRHPPET